MTDGAPAPRRKPPDEQQGETTREKRKVPVGALLLVVAIALACGGLWAWGIAALEAHSGLFACVAGAAIGVARRFTGGRGVSGAVACGLLTIAAVLMGEVVGFGLLAARERQEFAARLEAAYEEEGEADWHAMALAWDDSRASDEDVRRFLVEQALVSETDPARVPRSEVDDFRQGLLPEIRRIRAMEPETYKQEWLANRRAKLDPEGRQDRSTLARVGDEFSTVDLVFALFGAVTAVGIALVGRRPALKEQPYRRGSRGRRRSEPRPDRDGT